MKPLIPIIAVVGLVVVAILPAPGILGVTIGGCCIAVIVGWALAIVFRAAWAHTVAPVANLFEGYFRARRRRRELHAGSGLARKVRTAKA